MVEAATILSVNPADDSVDPLPPARTWRDRVARAAAADTGRPLDHSTVERARRLTDRGVIGARIGFLIIALLGAFAGWTATAELIRPADTPVHAPLLLAGTVALPWLIVALRALMLLAFRRRAMPVLGRLIPIGLVRMIRRGVRQPASPALAEATARHTSAMLANGSGRRLASAGGGVFWTVYGIAAIGTIWLSTARVAYGFGWESSWLSPSLGRSVTRAAAAPIDVLPGFDDLQNLVPVASPPTAAADDPEALELRRAWISFLTAGIGLYLVIPMGLWTLGNAGLGHWRAERWRPKGVQIPGAIHVRSTPVASPGTSPPEGSARTDPPSRITHRVELERPATAAPLPECLAELQDLGSIDQGADVERVAGISSQRDLGLAIIAWMPNTPDRGVRRRLREIAERAAVPPLVILDGGDHLRRAEPPANVAIRIGDWREALSELGLESLDVDLERSTTSSRALLFDRISSRSPVTAGKDSPDPARLDGAFAIIGRYLDDSSEAALPHDDALANCLLDLAREFDADPNRRSMIHGIDWPGTLDDLIHIDPRDSVRRVEAIRRIGVDLLPRPLQRGATWAGVGGILGVAACAAAATVAPAVLVAMPGWAGAGAGLAGLLSLVRRTDTPESHHSTDQAGKPELGDVVFSATTTAVLWWAQTGDEIRTEAMLAAVSGPTKDVPLLEDADAARRWLAATRGRVVQAMETPS